MCIRLCVLGSGSKGNCIYVGYDKTHILIDAGLPIRRIEKFISAMGIAPESLSVRITHEHSDHIKTLDALTKNIPFACMRPKNLAADCQGRATLAAATISFSAKKIFL